MGNERDKRSVTRKAGVSCLVCNKSTCVQAPTLSLGFRITVAKWLALVRLLLGEIPEHSELTAVGMKDALRPYFELTQAVRSGDLTAFKCVSIPCSFSLENTSSSQHSCI